MIIHRFIVASAILCIGACSTPGPQPQKPMPEVVEPVAEAAKPAAEVSKPIAEVTQADVSAPAGEEGLEVVAVPEVPKVVHNAPPPEVKCRQEKELGSRRIKRVCQTVTEAEQSQAEAEDALKRFQHMKDIQNPGIDL